jgi:hypothetical protein
MGILDIRQKAGLSRWSGVGTVWVDKIRDPLLNNGLSFGQVQGSNVTVEVRRHLLLHVRTHIIISRFHQEREMTHLAVVVYSVSLAGRNTQLLFKLVLIHPAVKRIRSCIMFAPRLRNE